MEVPPFITVVLLLSDEPSPYFVPLIAAIISVVVRAAIHSKFKWSETWVDASTYSYEETGHNAKPGRPNFLIAFAIYFVGAFIGYQVVQAYYIRGSSFFFWMAAPPVILYLIVRWSAWLIIHQKDAKKVGSQDKG